MNNLCFFLKDEKKYVEVDNKKGKELFNIMLDNYLKKVNSSLDVLLEGKSEKLTRYRYHFENTFLNYSDDLSKLNNLVKVIHNNSIDYTKPFTIDQIYDYHNSKVSGAVKKELYYNLLTFKGTETQPPAGIGEIFLALFTKLDRSTVGDLVDGKNIVEVKSNRGRFKGGDKVELKHVEDVIKELGQITKLKIDGKTLNKKTLKMLFSFVRTNIENKQIILKVINSLINFKGINPNKESYDVLKAIKTFENFLSYTLALHAYAYLVSEKINTIVFVNKFKGKFIPFKFENKFRKIYNFVKNNLINNAGWSPSKAAYEFDIR
jgi:hypothetical protein